MKKQLILAEQLVEHGANVNAVSSPRGETPLHYACDGYIVTKLDFVEFLLEKGTDPNAQDHVGLTPLLCTTRLAPGAAKILLNWPTTDPNILFRSGESFQGAGIREAVEYFFDRVARPDTPTRSRTNSCFGSVVQSKRFWRKEESLIPVSQLSSSGHRLRRI